MFYEELLYGPWGRIILVGIGAVALLLAFLLIACLLTPGCLGYECLRRRRKKNEEKESMRQDDQFNGNMRLGDVSYRSWRLGSLYDNDSICENGEISLRNSLSSTHKQWDTKASTTLNLVDTEKLKNEKKLKDFPTEVTLSLQFLPVYDQSKNHRGKLVIGIEALSGLPPKQYNCTVEPYVTVEIMKQSWTYRKRELLHSFRTRSIRHTASPIYRETFIIADVNSREAKEWMLVITAFDHDRYANDTELCSVRIPLKEVKKIFYSPELHLFNYKMKLSNQAFGNILLGISYLPTAQRLTINVMKLRDLKLLIANPKTAEFNLYVRVLMLNGKTGRKMKKKRTRIIRSSTQPEFNETLTFDLSVNQFDTVQFLVILCNKVFIDGIATIDHPSDSEDSTNSLNRCNNVYIGKVALGKGVRGSSERLHWFSVLQNPRKLVTVWHTLK